MSCALQIENNLVNGVEISESGTSTASSQSIDSKGDMRTSAQQKDEHTKESAKDPPLTASSLVLFKFIPVSAHRNSHRSLAVLKLRGGDELLDQSRLTEMKTTIDFLHVNGQEFFKGLAHLDDILELQSSDQIINKAVIRSCDSEIIHMNAEHDLPAVCKTTMEETTIIGRPSVANILKISRELIVESFWSTLQSIEGLLKLPDRGLAMDIWSKSFGQLQVDR
jgi:hypothetical protein